MRRLAAFVGVLTIGCLTASGQTTSVRRIVRAVGQASVSVQPDQAKIDIGVTTKAPTAQQAASQNAAQVEAVVTQLKQLVGASADIKTINYSINPDYRNSGSDPPVVAGYIANNTVEVTLDDLSLIGRAIDAASQAGANTISGLRFTIKNPEPARANALGLAAKQAKAHADAIASGLGARTGVVLSAEEGAVYGIRPMEARADLAATATPIETGLVEVQATVTVEVELL